MSLLKRIANVTSITQTKRSAVAASFGSYTRFVAGAACNNNGDDSLRSIVMRERAQSSSVADM